MERAQISVFTFHAIQQKLAVSSSIFRDQVKVEIQIVVWDSWYPFGWMPDIFERKFEIRTRSKAPCILRRKFFSSKRFQLSNIVEGYSTRFEVHISCSAVQHVLALTLCSTARLSKLVISAYLVASIVKRPVSNDAGTTAQAAPAFEAILIRNPVWFR